MVAVGLFGRGVREGRLHRASEERVDEGIGCASAQLEAQGYKIKKFKVDGNCYEIYGHNKDGKKVEIYYDTKTLAVVKSEVD